jgi:hypothetical protein
MHIAWLGKKSPFCGNVTYGREVTNSLLDRGYEVSFLHFAQEEARPHLAGLPGSIAAFHLQISGLHNSHTQSE